VEFRLFGTSDLIRLSGRRPAASTNCVTCHDGFTLSDLTSSTRKHNLANHEDNRDGSDENHSFIRESSPRPELNRARSPEARGERVVSSAA
jgi:glycogen operon protein